MSNTVCDYCGRSFGNAGACASHMNACDDKQTQPQQHPQQAQQAQPPAPQPQQGGDVPAAQGAGDSHLQLGAEFGGRLAKLGTGSPEEKAKAEGEVFQTLGAAIANFGSQKAQQKLEGIERSKQSEGLSVADNYVRCPECNTQIKDLPPKGHEFACPGCRVQLVSQ